MNARSLAAVLLGALLLTVAGCGKKDSGGGLSATDVSGVKVDIPKLQAAFVGAPAEIFATENDAVASIRYGLYEKALQSLDKLSSDPALTDPQKKAVNDVIEQMKQVIAKAGPSR